MRRRSASPGAAFGASRVLMRSSAADRAVDAGVAADGSGLIVVQSARGARRSVRAVAFGPRGRLGRPQALSAPGARADFAASAVASSGAAVVVWFRHRGARWRLEAATREPGRRGSARRRRSPPSCAFRAARACPSPIGARGDAAATWSSTARPAVWAALRGGRAALRRRAAPRPRRERRARVVVGDGGAVALTYSTQHVPLRAADGLQLRRAPGAGAFGPAEHVNPGGGVTIAGAAVTTAGRVLLAWRDQVHGARVHLSEAAPGQPLAAIGELGADVSAKHDRRGDRRRRARARRVVAAGVGAPRAGRRRAAFAAAARRSPPPSRWGRRGPPPRPAPHGCVAGGGALVAWNGARFGRPAQRRSALLVTRLR